MKIKLFAIYLISVSLSYSYTLEAGKSVAAGAYHSITSSNAVRATNNFTTNFDLTGVSYSYQNITMISPSFGVSSSHYSVGVGSVVKFYNRDGQAVERTIAQQWVLTGNGYTALDGRLSRMSTPLTIEDKVKWYPIELVEPNAWSNSIQTTNDVALGFGTYRTLYSARPTPDFLYTGTKYGLPALMLSAGQTAVMTLKTNAYNNVQGAGVFSASTYPNFQCAGFGATIGESSSPMFVILPDNRLVLLGTVWYSNASGTSHAGFSSNLLSIMSSYGEAPERVTYSAVKGYTNTGVNVTNQPYGYVRKTSTNNIFHVINYTNILENTAYQYLSSNMPINTVPVSTFYVETSKFIDSISTTSKVLFVDQSMFQVDNIYTGAVTNNGGAVVARKALAITNGVSGSGSIRCGTLIYTNGRWSLNAQ